VVSFPFMYLHNEALKASTDARCLLGTGVSPCPCLSLGQSFWPGVKKSNCVPARSPQPDGISKWWAFGSFSCSWRGAAPLLAESTNRLGIEESPARTSAGVISMSGNAVTADRQKIPKPLDYLE